MHPDVVVVGGISYCRRCDVFGCTGHITFVCPLSMLRTPADEMNGNYRLRWSAGVDYRHDDGSSGIPSSCLPGPSTTSTTCRDPASSNNHRGSSSACGNLACEHSGTAQTQNTRTPAGGDPYKPSRFYPVLLRNDEI
ncbi:hypothetical protein LZ32DRAFT_364782 [Colletotrichum eremochloae]|nr:hypothetical protein LZ32DRAFT_364782 [Colletotrichum eremochloae]